MSTVIFTFKHMISYKKVILFLLILLVSSSLHAQEDLPDYVANRKIYYAYNVVENDTILYGYIPNITIFRPLVFKNEKERIAYDRLVRDIKKTLPYAKSVSQSVIETYEVMQPLPDEKTKQKHLESVKSFMMDEYKPKMKKLSRRQGQVLIKLIDRECNTPSYNIVKSLVGSLQAGVYNVFAGIFGNSLKTEYDPKGKDKMMERIVIQVEEGIL